MEIEAMSTTPVANPVTDDSWAEAAWLDGWVAPPTDLIFDDGVPLESNRHRIAMNALIRSTNQALAGRSDFFAGGNMFVYYARDQAMNRQFRGPDFFVALGVEKDRERQGWVVWEENGHYPDVIVELLSRTTTAVDLGVKKDLYEQLFRTRNYFVYNPFDPASLQGWQLEAGVYQPAVRNEQGWLWCAALDLWFGLWNGVVDREPLNTTCQWLRFYDREGNLIPLPEEAAQAQAEQAQAQAEQAQAQAEQAQQELADLLHRLRQRGIDPDTL